MKLYTLSNEKSELKWLLWIMIWSVRQNKHEISIWQKNDPDGQHTEKRWWWFVVSRRGIKQEEELRAGFWACGASQDATELTLLPLVFFPFLSFSLFSTPFQLSSVLLLFSSILFLLDPSFALLSFLTSFFVSFSLVLSNPSDDSLLSGCLKGISAPPSDCDNSFPSLCLLHILYFLFHWLMG